LDFELTEEQKEIKMAARDFALKEFTKERALECELKEEFPWDLYRKAAKLGFICPHFKEEYGGQGTGLLETLLVHEEFVRADATLGQALMSGPFGSDLIHEFGSEEQKKKYLPLITRGEAVSSGAFTEPEHGSDLTSLSTTALKDGDHYVINGVKTFISNAPIASFYVVLCQTNPKASPPYRGQSLFIVERGVEGVDVTKITGKMGQKGTPIGEIFFNNARIPKEALLGQENRGFYYALRFFTIGRARAASYGVGMAQGAFDRALNYAKKRKQFGRPIIEFQAIQHKLAEMAVKIEAARMLTYRVGWAIDQGKYAPQQLFVMASMAKNYAAEVSNEVIDQAIQVFGGYGYILEYDVERYYRNARVLRIYEGTSEVNNNVIAEGISKGHYIL